ncbi:16544_t:CDS:10 [Dentiscutata heterogama]|uniref:16544_t:CDS:1 n=1 Tax=Dentiscutata heterogama TaxID=1316150 RepID=A0ACA9L3Z5_9GLOM|nr:16544_t:CDS:10 [Dentiscutata heterogama]
MNSHISENAVGDISPPRDAYHLDFNEEKDATTSPPAVVTDSIDQLEDSGASNDTDSGDENPIGVTVIDQATITESERKKNSEFFCGRGSKTPERYMKIRNFILNAWNSNKPKYVSKTSVRSGLKDCGDVNAIGRVHSYLELIGAINVGDDLVKRKQRTFKPKVLYDAGKSTNVIKKRKGKTALVDENWTLNGRGKKSRNEERASPNEYDDDGEEGTPGDNQIRRSKRTRTTYDMVGSYDPFRLVPPLNYTSRNPAPFRVSVTANVMLVMDFHAHLAHTEIIGLLGGHFHPDSESMEVTYVFPCRSASTGFQCEMDPASEVAAREVFAEKGLQFVGWYHSHPTFEPQPSVRDIENQTQYQEMWRREDGVEPFIGVIVTPYDAGHESNVSRFQFWVSGTNYDLSGQFRTPYSCQHSVSPSASLPEEMFTQLSELIEEYQNYDQRVDMTESFRNEDDVSRLDKMLESLSSHISVASSTAENFISRVRELMKTNFRPDKKSSAECHGNTDSIIKKGQE